MTMEYQESTQAVLIPDTNLFLHHFEFFKDLVSELPFPTLQLLIPFVVLQELDQLKVFLNNGLIGNSPEWVPIKKMLKTPFLFCWSI
jgi:hypothetical protein